MRTTAPELAIVARGLTKGGVGRFVESILSEWDIDSVNNATILVFTDEKLFIKKYPNLEIIYIPKAPKIIWDNILLLSKVFQYKPSSIIYTKNVIPLTHLLGRWKKNVIVYDLGYFYPKLNAYAKTDTLYMKLMMTLSLPFAHKIMSISKFTKSEIVKFTKVPSNKIEVIYLGVNEKFKKIKDKNELKKVKDKYELKMPFAFYAGSLSPRKNLLRLVKAFNKIKDNVPHTLYLVCGKKWNTEGVQEYILSNKLDKRVIILPFISESELLSFYSLADAFLYPSLYEGFGLPIIEAQACGCPVLTSSTTSCGEISSNAVIKCNPLSVNDISEKLLKILKEKNIYYLNPDLIKKKYSWKKTATKLMKLCLTKS